MGRVHRSPEGRGNLYWSAWLEYFTLEENITSAGNEIFVEREYYRLTQKPGTVGQKLEYDRETLNDGDMLGSGDLIEIELRASSGNDYRYVVFEDYKAAGCEPVQLRSGRSFGGLWTNMELRDEKVAFFASLTLTRIMPFIGAASPR